MVSLNYFLMKYSIYVIYLRLYVYEGKTKTIVHQGVAFSSYAREDSFICLSVLCTTDPFGYYKSPQFIAVSNNC